MLMQGTEEDTVWPQELPPVLLAARLSAVLFQIQIGAVATDIVTLAIATHTIIDIAITGIVR